MHTVIHIQASQTAILTKFDVRAGLTALISVQDQKANFEEEAVWGHVQAAHFVEAVAADHQSDESDPFTQHVDVVHNPIDSCSEQQHANLA